MDLTAIESLVAQCEAAHEQSTIDLDSAREKAKETKDLRAADPTPHRRKAYKEAKEALEECEDVHKFAGEQLANARKALKDAQGQQLRAQLAALEESLKGRKEDIEEAARAFIEIDEKIHALAKGLAEATKRDASAWEMAISLAQDLGQGPHFQVRHPRPSLAEARLEIQRKLRDARRDAKRPAYAPLWMQSADVKENGYTAAELDSVRPHVERVREEQKVREIFEAGLIAGANAVTAKAPDTTTTTEQAQ